MLDGLMLELPADQPRRALILRALERMLDAMDPDDVAGTAAAGRAELAGGAGLAGVGRARTSCTRSAMRTSTRRGCGRSGRRSASAPARSPPCWT